MSIVRSIIFVILMLGVLASLHELAHFWVARLLKIKVYEVSLFVGPKLLSWKHNDVNFTIRLIPIGAYVRFNEIDEEGYIVDSDNPGLLANQPRFKRLLVALAGPFMNLILGILIFFVMFWVMGFQSTKINVPVEGAQTGAVASEYTPGDSIKAVNGVKVYTSFDLVFELENDDPGEVMILTLKSQETGKDYDLELTPEFYRRPMLLIYVRHDDIHTEYDGWYVNSVDEEQNKGNPVLQSGDYVMKINGKSVSDPDFDEYLFNMEEQEYLYVTYIRDGKEDVVEIAPEYVDYVSTRGIRLISSNIDSPANFMSALGYAAKMPASIVNISFRGIKQIISGKEKAYNLLSGPIGITTVVNDVVKEEEDTVAEKLITLVMMSAVISIALAFSNLLPIPGLDGIQIIFIVVEMVIGHKLSEKAENRLTIVGFVIIILLLILAFISDILRIIFGY